MTDPNRAYIRDKDTGRWHEVKAAGTVSLKTFCGKVYGEASIDGRTSWPPHGNVRACSVCRRNALRRRA